MSTNRVPRFGEPLSDREVEIVRLLAEGLTNSRIAVRAGLAPETVKTHLYRISKKLGADGRMDLLWRAEDAGLVPSSRPRRPGAVARPDMLLVPVAAWKLLLAFAEQAAAGRPAAALRRSAMEALTAAGRRGPDGRPLVPAARSGGSP